VRSTLVSKRRLGNQFFSAKLCFAQTRETRGYIIFAKQSLASIYVPKEELGNEEI
jgi:hypothetical protein